jgi:hypothetical protein
MTFEICLPRILDRGLESEYEYSLGAKLFGQLVRGERLSEPHLRVPKEARDRVHVLLPDGVEIGVRLVHGLDLLAAHREGLGMCACERLAGAQFCQHGLNVLDRAAHPLQFDVLDLFPDERCADVVIGEDRAVVPRGWFVQLDPEVLDCRSLELLGDALFYVARRLSDL